MNRAAKLNQYAKITAFEREKEKNQRTITWVENKLFPHLEHMAKQGNYRCCLPIAQKNHAEDNDYFEDVFCPTDGININLVTETLVKNGFYVEDTGFSYFISWESKYIY